MWIEPALAVAMVAVAPSQGQRRFETAFLEARASNYGGVSWHVSFFNSGIAHQEIHEGCLNCPSYSRIFAVRKEELEALREAILRTTFMELPDEIPAEDDVIVNDDSLSEVTTWNHGVSHTVRAFGLERSQSEFAPRFRLVWSLILQLSPDPTASVPKRRK